MNHRYRKRPVVIEAFQMTRERREDNTDWPPWLNEAWNLGDQAPGAVYMLEPAGHPDRRLCINTLEGRHVVGWGDWIIRGVAGELYPCKPDIFAATYEPASTPEGT